MTHRIPAFSRRVSPFCSCRCRHQLWCRAGITRSGVESRRFRSPALPSVFTHSPVALFCSSCGGTWDGGCWFYVGSCTMASTFSWYLSKDGASVPFYIPIHVTEGRFFFEKISTSSQDRQALFKGLKPNHCSISNVPEGVVITRVWFSFSSISPNTRDRGPQVSISIFSVSSGTSCTLTYRPISFLWIIFSLRTAVVPLGKA